jgi:hypothetical protein
MTTEGIANWAKHIVNFLLSKSTISFTVSFVLFCPRKSSNNEGTV